MEKINCKTRLENLIGTLSRPKYPSGPGPTPARQIAVLKYFSRAEDCKDGMSIPTKKLADGIDQILGTQTRSTKSTDDVARLHALRELLRQLNRRIRKANILDIVFVFDKAEVRLLAQTDWAREISADKAKRLDLAKALRQQSAESKPGDRALQSTAKRGEEMKKEYSASTAGPVTPDSSGARKRESTRVAGVTRASMFSGMEDSPYCLDNLLPRAKKDAILIGPNLWWAAKNSREAIFSWLDSTPPKSTKVAKVFRLLLSDPSHKCGLEYLGRFDRFFSEHLSDAIKELKAWLREAKKRRLCLRVHTSRIVSMGILAIDPRTPQGKIVLTPILRGESVSGKRPHIYISKRDNPAIFLSYWSCIDTLWKESKPLPL